MEEFEQDLLERHVEDWGGFGDGAVFVDSCRSVSFFVVILKRDGWRCCLYSLKLRIQVQQH